MIRWPRMVSALALLTFVAFGSGAGSACAQATGSGGAGGVDEPVARTKSEAFVARDGVVLIKGFGTATKLPGRYGSSVEIEPREFIDASDGKHEYSLAVTVKEAGTLERDDTSYVDLDEIDSLIKGLDYIAKVDSSVTKLERFEASYRTRGDLMVTMFQAKNGSRCAVSSGRVGPVTAFLDPETAAKLRDAVASAKERLDSIRKQ